MKYLCRSKSFCFSIVVLLAALVVVSSCSKKKPADAASTVLTSSLLKKLPSETTGFMVWNSKTEAFKKFLKSPWGKDIDQAVDQFDTVVASFDESKKGKHIFEWFKNSFLVPFSKTKQPPIEENLIFHAAQQDIFNAAIYFKAAPNTDFSQKLKELKEVLKKEKINFTEKKFAKVSGLEIDLTQFTLAAHSPTPDLPKKAYFAANQSHLAVSFTEALINHLFDEASLGDFKTIQESALFKRALAKVHPVNDQLGFGYFDFNKFAKAVLEHTKKDPTAHYSNEIKDLDLEQFPVQAIVGSQQLKEAVIDTTGAILVDINNEKYKGWLKLLAAPTKKLSIEHAPSSANLYLSVSKNVIDTIKKVAMDNATPDMQPQIAQQTKLLEPINDIGIGVTNAVPGTLFPGVIVLAKTDQAEDLKTQLKQLAGGMLGHAMPGSQMPTNPMPGMNWQTKKIAEKTVEYMLSPLGVGIFLISTSDALIVTSSEQVMKEALEVVAGTKAGVLKSLSPLARKAVEQKSLLITTYINLPGFADLLESMQGSMAMFTGGQQSPELQMQIEQFRKAGRALTSIYYDRDAVGFRMLSEKTH